MYSRDEPKYICSIPSLIFICLVELSPSPEVHGLVHLIFIHTLYTTKHTTVQGKTTGVLDKILFFYGVIDSQESQKHNWIHT